MLRHAPPAQCESFERLRVIFKPNAIMFTLIGAAACREHGLARRTDDLDIVVSPYRDAMSALHSTGEFVPTPESVDWTSRTCTLKDTRTGVLLDFLTGGIRINDHTFLPRGVVHDPLPIPIPSGYGDVAALPVLIGMKVSAIISGMKILELGATSGVRTTAEIRQDVEDVQSLIFQSKLPRDLPLGNNEVESRYQQIFDDVYMRSAAMLRRSPE